MDDQNSLLGGISDYLAQSWDNVLSVIDSAFGDPDAVAGRIPAYGPGQGPVASGSGGDFGQEIQSLNPFSGNGNNPNWKPWVAALLFIAVLFLIVALIHELRSA